MTVENTVELAGGVVVAVGSPSDDATFTLTSHACDDRRAVTVPSVPDALAELTDRRERQPHATAICDDVLRALDPAAPPLSLTSPTPWPPSVTPTVC